MAKSDESYLSMIDGNATFPKNTRRQLQKYVLKLRNFPRGL
jgi:hypothetical protein